MREMAALPKPLELRFEWQCPHCGHVNTALGRVTSKWGTMETKVVYCDTEEGGCGCRVAVEPCAAVAAAVYKLVPVERRYIEDTDMTARDTGPTPDDDDIPL